VEAHSPREREECSLRSGVTRRIDAALRPGASEALILQRLSTCPGLPLPRFAPAPCWKSNAGRVSLGLEGVCPWRILLLTAAHRRRLHGAGEPRGASAIEPACVNAALARHFQSPANGRFDEYSGSSPLGALGGGRDSRCLARTSDGRPQLQELPPRHHRRAVRRTHGRQGGLH
jgi:hypothetical protein